jgi:hypothetical protein
MDVVTPFRRLLDVRTQSRRRTRALGKRNHGRDEQLHQAEHRERHDRRKRSLADWSNGSIRPAGGQFHQMTGST